VATTFTERGKRETTLTPGAIFGQLNLMGQKIYHTFALPVTPSDVCVISHLELIGLIRRKPRLVVKVMEIVSQRIMKIERRLSQMVFLTVPSRLALLLLDLNDQNIDLGRTTHQELADMLGVYRETVSTAIIDFRAWGFIHATRTQFELIDRQGLEAFVERSVMLTQIQIKG
jgi:CRP-like cAMP-binding protein